MAEIRFQDVTLRDGHQSLWATRMTTEMMLPIAARLDGAGFEAIDLTGPVYFDVCIRYLRENPWERVRLIRSRVEHTPLNAWVRSACLIEFDLAPTDVLELWLTRIVANGCSRLTVFDPLHSTDNYAPTVRVARETGAHLVLGLVYSLSPVHTDSFYTQVVQDFVRLGADSILIKDPSGLLTPERIRTLLPAVKSVSGNLPVQLHSHASTGLAPIVYLEAMKLGVSVLHTAIPPLANGPSLPAVGKMIEYAEHLGLSQHVDGAAIDDVSKYFWQVAKRENKPTGQIAEYDPRHYEHQIPGGMLENFKSQLGQAGLDRKLDEVLVEVGNVRQDLGYPVMVTPFSQWVGMQALLNVIHGERYKIVLDPVKKYVCGYFGELTGPVDSNVMDRIMERGSRRIPEVPQPLEPVLPTLRRQYPRLDDDELLLRYMFPSAQVDAALGAGPIRSDYDPADRPVRDVIALLSRSANVGYFELRRGDFSLRWWG